VDGQVNEWLSGGFALGGALLGAASSWILQSWINRRDERAAARIIFLELAKNQLALAAILQSGSPQGGLLSMDAWRTHGHRIGLILTPEELVTVAEPYFQLPTLLSALAQTAAADLGSGVTITESERTLAQAISQDIGEAASQLGRKAFGERRLGQVRERLQRGP
jgi:hypothetical protein